MTLFRLFWRKQKSYSARLDDSGLGVLLSLQLNRASSSEREAVGSQGSSWNTSWAILSLLRAWVSVGEYRWVRTRENQRNITVW